MQMVEQPFTPARDQTPVIQSVYTDRDNQVHIMSVHKYMFWTVKGQHL